MRKRAEKVSPLGSSITEVLKGLGLHKKYRQYRVWEVWDRVVGDRIASVAQPDRMDFDTLFVAVGDSLWLQQLRYLQEEILDKLNKALGSDVVSRIFFRLGDPREQGTARPSEAGVQFLPKLEPEEMGAIDDIVQGLKDTECRDLLRKILMKSAAFEKVKSDNTYPKKQT